MLFIAPCPSSLRDHNRSVKFKKHSNSCPAIVPLCLLLQSFQISEEVVNIGLPQLAQQFPMGRKGIPQLYLHLFTRKRSIPTRTVAQRNHKLVDMLERPLDLFTRRKRYDHGCLATLGIKHMSFEIDGRVLSSDLV